MYSVESEAEKTASPCCPGLEMNLSVRQSETWSELLAQALERSGRAALAGGLGRAEHARQYFFVRSATVCNCSLHLLPAQLIGAELSPDPSHKETLKRDT